mmetsp:Transcript_39248/g.42544  ORF Transcript_39248/g.42544 Transcript_39248/m.42544 type:complete len:111 (+) Transcript_39248:166-498(+)
MEMTYTPASRFSGGFTKAMEYIEMIVLEAANTGFGTIGAQDYKWANVVIDEETGVFVDLKKLLKHPKHTQHQMNMDKYSKAVEERKMDHNKWKEKMRVIGLERIKFKKIK